jgi:hypothetical protein
MTFLTVDGLVCACERKIRGTVIEYVVGTASRVAGQTSRIIVLITIHPVVLLVGIRIGMTTDTGEIGIIGRILVTISTLVPFALVFAAVNRKQHIVLLKFCRHPVRIGGVTS